MSQVKTNNVSLSYAVEQTLGVLPGSPTWKLLEPNTINTFGADIGTVSRNPISKSRQRRKGTITDLDSGSEWEADVTLDSFLDFGESFVMATAAGPLVFSPLHTDQVTACDADSFTVTGTNPALAQRTLIFVRGFANAANNGLFEVAAAATSTDIPVQGGGLTAEASPPTEARLEVAGVVGQTGDIDVDVTGGVTSLTSTLLDFTTLGLTVGQSIHVGGTAAINRFTNAANFGFARIVSITANAMVIDKTQQTFVTEADTTQSIQLLFGQFLRNVDVDDAAFLQQSFHFEGAYPDLEAIGTDAYEYSVGNRANTMAVSLPLTDKATVVFGFVGTDVEVPTTTRKTNADSPVLPIMTTAMNTTADIARLRIQQTDETGLTTFFKSLTFTINNGITPEKVIGLLGAAFINEGNFEVDIEAQVLFTNKDVVAAIRNNDTVGLDFSMRNDDGALLFDIPAMTLGGGGKDFPVNETVLLNLTGQAHQDPTLGTSVGISTFAFVPAA